jgi:hypothetical protein
MHVSGIFRFAALILPLIPAPGTQAQQPANQPIPDIHQLMSEVREHQKNLEKTIENYTFNTSMVIQDLDSKGQVTKTETKEFEEFFVHGAQIGRLVKKDGKPLTDEEQKKETERVTKTVENAEKPKTEDPKKEEQGLSLSKILEAADVRNPRREIYRGRPTFVFDFVGRKDFKAHNASEDVSKKLQGTVWIDEADRIVAHLDVSLIDNFHVAGGLLANIEKGSNFHFDQAPINGEVWLQTGVDATMQARILLVKGIRQHLTVHNYDYKRFRVETQQLKDAKVSQEKSK